MGVGKFMVVWQPYGLMWCWQVYGLMCLSRCAALLPCSLHTCHCHTVSVDCEHARMYVSLTCMQHIP
jgi:hypothetical protein